MKAISKTKAIIFGLSLCVAMNACGGATSTTSTSTGSATTSSDTTGSAGAAAGALFGGSSSSSLSISTATLQRYANAALDENSEVEPSNTTCDFVESDENENIAMDTYGDEGIYGSEDYSVDVTADDFCTQPDGTDNEGDDLFATFEIEEAVTGTCTGDDGDFTVAMEAGSAGVWRNTDEYYPEIYGNFIYLITDAATGAESEVAVDCTIYLGEDEDVLFADCTDEDGAIIEQTEDASCEFDAGDDSEDQDSEE
jgi:hypothetical protein